ncbi:MAG: DHA2 family multidrug resistance protein [Loktanella salsilacus]|jgi:DHA2 family multidrug resistance protein
MFCLLPPTRMALGHLTDAQVPDASGVFNLMRNLGGAIGLALIDTVIYARGPVHAADLTARLASGDAGAASFIGIPASLLTDGAPSPAQQAMLAPLLEKASLTMTINDAWMMMAAVTALALICIPFARQRAVPQNAME